MMHGTGKGARDCGGINLIDQSSRRQGYMEIIVTHEVKTDYFITMQKGCVRKTLMVTNRV